MALILAICIMISPIFAEKVIDLGVLGKVYPIEEEPLTEFIQTKLQYLSKSDLLKKQMEVQRHIQKTLHEPKQVQGIRYASKNYHYYITPETAVHKDMVCPVTKKVFARQGDRFNTLKHHQLQSTLLFLDGENQKHIKWAKSQGKHARWILVKGRPLDLMRKQKHPIYFDQQGALTHKLDIRDIPCVVKQEGEQLRIQVEGGVNE